MKFLLLTVAATLGFAAATMAQNVPSYVPTNGLVGWWPFNGNANDESGNGNNGIVNGASLTADRFGNANKAYATASGYISVLGTTMPTNSPISISFWFNCNSDFGIGEIICLGNPSSTTWGCVGGNNYFTTNYGRGCGSTGSSPLTIPLNYGTWHHVVYVSSGLNTNSNIYYDGVLVGNATNANSNNNCSNAMLYFGVDIYSSLENYDGKLDDIGIWNRVLTQQEITALYNGCQQTVNSQPANQTIPVSSNAQFTVGSSDPSATFQWQTDLGVGFQNLNSVGQYSGTTNDTLTVSNVTMSNNNQPFRCIITSGSCTDTSAVAVLTVNNTVGSNEISPGSLFSVFPNPAQNVINLKADATLLGESYAIMDNAGRTVLSGTIASETTMIELGNLSGGIYIFNIGKNMKQQFKIGKQ